MSWREAVRGGIGSLVIGCLIAAATAPAEAQEMPDEAAVRFARAAGRILPGTRVAVIEADGRYTSGIVERATPDAITLLESGGGHAIVPARRIAHIIIKDSNRNGTMIGLAIGAGGGLGFGLLLNMICSNESGPCPGAVALMAGLGGAIGAGVGAAADTLHQSTVFSAAGDVPGEFTPEVGAGIGGTRYTFPLGGSDVSPAVFTASWSDLRRRGFGLDVHTTRTLAPRSVRQVPCVTSDSPFLDPSLRGVCLGNGYSTVTKATSLGATLVYTFGGTRVRPYLAGGAELQRLQRLTPEVHIFSGPNHDVFQVTSTIASVNALIGGGARISLNRHVSVRPDVTMSFGSDLNAVRASVGLGYRW